MRIIIPCRQVIVINYFFRRNIEVLAMTEAPDYMWMSILGDPNQACGIGALGCVFALFFANVGAAIGTAKSGCAIL